jgi:NAD(P)-dependent dehydrogenase (short-subunit alcohol dehydrogenase family)
MLCLKGKAAVVTGGSGTIGKAISKQLLKAGCNVHITGRNEQRLVEAKTELMEFLDGQKDTGKVSTFAGDVTNQEDVINLFDTVGKSNAGGVDLLVNNAGIMAPGTSEELAAEDFSRVMEVNVLGPFLCAREAMKRMKAKDEQGGRIINIGSISAIATRGHGAPYTTSKFAILGLTHSLHVDAREYDISVGIIHPGNVLSGFLTPELAEERGRTEGFVAADEVATCVYTMASMPYSTNVWELTVMPNKQALLGRG